MPWYVFKERILYEGSFTSRTGKAHIVIHCNFSPQRTKDLKTPLKENIAVLNIVNTCHCPNATSCPISTLINIVLFLPWIMHGLVACNIKIEVCRVLHLVSVPGGLNPVSYWETINTIHQVVFIISTATVVVRPIA